MIATYPLGGVVWDYAQYALGLEEMGFEVFYVEDAGFPSYAKNPETGEHELEYEYGANFLEASLRDLSPSLSERWHFRDSEDRAHGLPFEDIHEAVAGADILINVSGGCLLREKYRRCPRKVFIDTDPGWNHFEILPRWDRKPAAERPMGFRGHDFFFSCAQRVDTLPDFGLEWSPVLQPVVLDRWENSAPPGERWTTLMSWDNYEGSF